MTMDISFLIVNYFTAELVRDLVESIRKNISAYTYQILIADNSGSESQKAMLDSLSDENTRVYYLDDNPGFVKANNYLAEIAGGRILILINPDTFLIDNSLEKLIFYFLKDEAAGIIGPCLLNDDETYQVSFHSFPYISGLIKEHLLLYRKNPYADYDRINETHECDVVKGACLIIKKEISDRLGLFDTDLVMYSEEVDLCYRTRLMGKKVIYCPEAKIVHLGERSSSQSRFTEYSLYHYYRSKFIFYRKHFSTSYYLLVKAILMLSLVEKAFLLFVFGRNVSSRMHWNVLQKIKKNSF